MPPTHAAQLTCKNASSLGGPAVPWSPVNNCTRYPVASAAQALLYTLRALSQHGVPCGVTVLIVDTLEMIYVTHGNCDRMTEARSPAEAGQQIVGRLAEECIEWPPRFRPAELRILGLS